MDPFRTKLVFREENPHDATIPHQRRKKVANTNTGNIGELPGRTYRKLNWFAISGVLGLSPTMPTDSMMSKWLFSRSGGSGGIGNDEIAENHRDESGYPSIQASPNRSQTNILIRSQNPVN